MTFMKQLEITTLTGYLILSRNCEKPLDVMMGFQSPFLNAPIL